MRVITLLVIGLLTASCATPAGSGQRTNPDRLTRTEIEESHQVNAYDVVRSLRPQWLRVRGPNSFSSENPIMVYVDGVRYGTVNELSSLSVLTVEAMRYYDPTEAQARWGLNNTNGAIEVMTRRQ